MGNSSSQDKPENQPPQPQPKQSTSSTSSNESNKTTPTTTNSATPQSSAVQIPTRTRTASYRSYNSNSQSPVLPKIALPASQTIKHSANNYVMPAAVDSMYRKATWGITPCSNKRLKPQLLRVCPQYNGQGCIAVPCRRLHVCLYWATKTCNKNLCKYDHNVDSLHNVRLFEACGLRWDSKIDKSLGTSDTEDELEICMFNVLKRCTQKPCTRVHSTKNYSWQVSEGSEWIQFSYNQSDYLEMMYSHPSEECADLIPLQAHIPQNRNLQKLAGVLSKETLWTVDFETFKLKGRSSEHDIRRLSTVSDLTSRVPVATRWVWYWEGDNGCWEPYTEGTDTSFYYVALSDYLEYVLQTQKKRFAAVDIGQFSYFIDGKKMIQRNHTTNKVRRIRRRPACTLIQRKSIKFDEVFWPQPTTKKFFKFPLVSLSSEFLFVENLLKQGLRELKIAGIHRVQNDHLWKVYQNKKRLLTSLYNGDVTATNEQYLFHGTSHNVVDHICKDNLDWRLYGTNVGHMYGQGIYFTNMVQLADYYAKSNESGYKLMLVVLVLVGKMTRGHSDMNFPPMNPSSGRNYDTTCNEDTNATIFVKYDRDEYYPAYIVKYRCNS